MRLDFILTLLFVLVSITMKGQEDMAEEAIRVDASSASLLQWLDQIEKQTGIILSYNTSIIDLNKKHRFQTGGTITIKKLLEVLLKEYDYRLIPLPQRKLLIQVDRVLYFELTGTVKEVESHEKLLGATVLITDKEGDKRYVLTDKNGVFNTQVRQGPCKIEVSYMGYTSHKMTVEMKENRFVTVDLNPVPFEMNTVNVKRRKSMEDFEEMVPSNMVTFNSNDLFSQIKILPGVTSSIANVDFAVKGGATDENLFLLDGFPVYSPQHINSMLSPFNGDALKSVSFHRSFIPTEYEGRLSSVIDSRLRDGNKEKFVHTLSIDMPAVSAVLEGPILKNKLSYLVGGRHSWLNLFDQFRSAANRTNLTFYDFNAKLSLDLGSTTSLSFMAYNSTDDYHDAIKEGEDERSILHWNNQLYALNFNTMSGSNLSNNTSVAYSMYTNRADARAFGVDELGIRRCRLKSIYALTEFKYTPGTFYSSHFGVKGTFEQYDLALLDTNIQSRRVAANQLSFFYDNRIRITPRFYAQLGLNLVMYFPRGYKHFQSIQPRMALKYSITDNDLLYANYSRSEQFFHHVMVVNLATPFDFLLPSIDDFKPRGANHYELGWKHYLKEGIMEASLYYKYRTDILTFRPDAYLTDSDWSKYIMAGTGTSYGASFYINNRWKRFHWQLAYTYSVSRERFKGVKGLGEVPSLSEVPHLLNYALSYQFLKHSTITVGGNMYSGRLKQETPDNYISIDNFRKQRDITRYRLDASYTFTKQLKKSKLLLRFGLYNIIGNPTATDLLYFFTLRIKSKCLPYGTISFRF